MLMLSGEIVSRLRRIQRGKCHPQSVKTCEQSREIQNSCDFDEQRHVQKFGIVKNTNFRHGMLCEI